MVEPSGPPTFDYREMVGRNRGFVTADEQERLGAARVFVCGVGGMGGAALQSLTRAGLQHFTLADGDRFEVSNLNRQVFANVDQLDRSKVDATTEQLRRINPEIEIETYDRRWTEHLDDILPGHPVVINGMDDIAAGIHLYREARRHGATVIDAYSAPLPSVMVVRPGDPRPEERYGLPTPARDWQALTRTDIESFRAAETEHVLVHSSSADHIDLEVAAEAIAGRGHRPSFAPMVITAGNLMAFEAVAVILGKRTGVDHRGCFFNPWTFRVERPRGPLVAGLRRFVARRRIRALSAGV